MNWWRSVGLCISLALVAAACADGSAHQVVGLSGSQNAAPIEVIDHSDRVDSAAIFLAGGLAPDADHDPLVILPGERGFDFEVAYRSGRMCQTVPRVEVRETGDGLSVAVESFDREYADDGGKCRDIAYSVAIGFVLTSGAPAPASVSVAHTAS